MLRHDIREILACLSDERRIFRYYKDRYAPLLLGYAVGDGITVRELKQSRFAPLLERPCIKETLALFGGGLVTEDLLEAAAPLDPVPYALTLGRWGPEGKRRLLGSNYQTTRGGQNLVVHLNFTGQHDAEYRRIMRPKGDHPFVCYSHPVAGEGYNTLCWVRLDLDLATGEALIEEVQNDWIRIALRRRDRLRHQSTLGYSVSHDLAAMHEYIERVLTPHMPLWEEAALAAAIRFVRDELGLRHIYYHTFEAGNVLKRIRYGAPPRSIYTALPRRFCFRATDRIPLFLERDRGWRRRIGTRRKDVRFNLLEL